MQVYNVFIGLLLGLSALSYQGLAKEKTYGLDHPHVPGELIVKFKAGIPKHLKERVSEILKSGSDGKNRSLGQLQESTVVLDFNSELSKTRSAKSDLYNIAQKIDALNVVEYVEANNIISGNITTPTDPDFSYLWSIEKVQASKAWDISTGSKDVLVAIIDTGVDYNHEDLRHNMWTNPGESGYDIWLRDKRFNGVDDDENGFVDDWRGWDFRDNDNDPMDENRHGTHVAGTIGATPNNGKGISGLAWDVSMVGVRYLGSNNKGRTSDAIKAIRYASKLGVQITNNSWGSPSYSQALRDAIQESTALFVVAAGNDSHSIESNPEYPAAYSLDNILAVGASNREDQKSSFSNFGEYSVDVIAPGSSIYSTVLDNSYEFLYGTSMATPLVTGIAVLIKARYPYLSATEIKNKITMNTDYVSDLSRYSVYGRVNAFKALGGQVNPQPNPSNDDRCNKNYLYVDSNSEVGVYNPFCVMKYEAKYDWGAKASSKDESYPWVNVTWHEAKKACQDNGYGYDLINNQQWQAIARSIEANPTNWKNGSLNHGHSDASPNHSLIASYDDHQGCFSTEQYCYSRWNSQKRTHQLQSGSVIWDIGGNVLEWTSTEAPYKLNNQYLAYAQGNTKFSYGPRNNYYQQSGFGYLYSNYWSYGAIVVRGGGFGNHDKTGVFATDLQHTRYAKKEYLGFRCIHQPK